MEGKKRMVHGYEIIESRTAGELEIVIGHNPNAPSPYSCWYCRNGEDYYWGCYTDTLDGARKAMDDRCRVEREMEQRREQAMMIRRGRNPDQSSMEQER